MGGSTEHAIELITIYERTGRLPVLHEAVAEFRAVLAATKADNPDHPARLSNVLLALRMLADRTGQTADLEQIADVSRQLAQEPRSGERDRLFALFCQVEALQALAERTGQQSALQALVAATRQLAAGIPAGDPDRVAVLCNLGAALLNLYERTGRTEVIQEAVQVGQQALAAAPPDLPDRPIILSNLGAALRALYERTGAVAILEEAVAAGRQAVADTPEGHPNRPGYLSNLGTALRLLGGRTGQTEQLEEAVTIGRRAVSASRADDRDRAKALCELGTALRTLGGRTGRTEYLEGAVTIGRQAAAIIPADHPFRPGCLANLGGMLRALGEFAGQVPMLEEAVATGRQAVKAAPAGHPHCVKSLCNLANALRVLFDYTGRSEALAEAVAADVDALERLPRDHPDRALLLVNLSGVLLTVGTRTGQLTALEDAAARAREAAAITDADHPLRAMCLSNLAAALHSVFSQTSRVELLTEAVDAGRAAVAATPADHPDRGRYLANLMAGLQQLYGRTGRAALLAEAVAAGGDAVALTPTGHPNRAGYQFGLGSALLTWSEQSGAAEAAAEAAACYAAAARSETAPALTRLRAHRAWAAMPSDLGAAPRSPDQILEALEAAIGLLPQAVSRHLPRGDREHAAGLLAGLAAQAAAAAVSAGRPVRAAELLEQSRGILVADILNARSGEVARLRENRAALAEGLAAEFEALQRRIQALDRDDGLRPAPGAEAMTSFGVRQAFYGASPPAESRAAARREADAEWQALLERIRAVGDLGDFLRLDQIERLTPAAADGPVVYIYADQSRCDALILTGDPDPAVRLVPLPGLNLDEAMRQTTRFIEARDAARTPGAGPAGISSAQAEILGVLAWLWDTIAAPVMAALGHTTATGSRAAGPGGPAGSQASHVWPRVWWCPVGFLTYLPFHAAGHHDDPATGERRAVLDRVISSYTPTARALAYARSHPQRKDSERTVIIAVPGTPPLPGVQAQAAELASLIPGAYRLPSPTRAAVLDALPGASVAHFACHGIADPADASDSRLVLDDYQSAPLTVADISALRLTGASLAYLSACETTVTTPGLSDEAVHITGAFHLAGYRHVIGTLWPIYDDLARTLDVEVYQHLTSQATTPPQTASTAQALHHAIRALRDDLAGEPAEWAAHIHVGS
jgi:hypothetical protein